MSKIQRLVMFSLATGGLVLGSQSADAQWRARHRYQAPVYTPAVEVRQSVPVPQVQVTTPAPQIQGEFRTNQAIQQTGAATLNIPRASAILNAQVSLAGASFPGRIVDFIISPNGCIEHVVISHNNRFVMLPFQLVRFDAPRNMVHVNIQADQFRQAPTFTQWSMVADPRFTEQVNTFFGVSARGDVRFGPDGAQIQVNPGAQQQLQQPQQLQLPQPQQQQQRQVIPPQGGQQQQQTLPPLPNRQDQQQINTPPIPPDSEAISIPDRP